MSQDGRGGHGLPVSKPVEELCDEFQVLADLENASFSGGLADMDKLIDQVKGLLTGSSCHVFRVCKLPSIAACSVLVINLLHISDFIITCFLR